ncbi:MAG: hypothetical protein IH623_21890 [Verrucomicrobia bacterium]|nr:hypothetical protein [Verrucomicrobiota bacterium]
MKMQKPVQVRAKNNQRRGGKQAAKETAPPVVFAYKRRGARGALSITHNGRKCAQVPFDSAMTEYVEVAAARAGLNVAEYVQSLIANHRDRNGAGERAGDVESVTLEFCGAVTGRTEIPGEQFLRMKSAAKSAGVSVAKFLEHGIGAKLRQLEAELVSPNFSDPLSVLLGQLCRQFPDSIQERKTLLRSLLCVLTDEHPASPAVQAQLIVLESLDVLDRELPGKFSGAATTPKQERAALRYVAESHDCRKPADLRCMADELSREVAQLRLAADVISRDGEAAWDREGHDEWCSKAGRCGD